MSDPIIPAKIDFVNIEEEMQRDYIDYSMSVIIGRALPDARDGLKPVNRRILYAMQQGGWSSGRPFVKCARVVGDVMGKYHPHGDIAIYDALVRMAQEFSMRAPLIQSQGNFGSIDGDPAAAYRYTECKLNRLSEELLADIEKDTVDMRRTYDEQNEEPSVLPTRVPNLLVNGSTGIAVGMATNIPPHNLGEVVDAAVYLIDHPESSIRDLMQFVKGPDFPTSGLLIGVNEVIKMYETGRGLLKLRGRATIEQDAKGRETILITEIPYTVNKAMLISRMAELVNEKKIEGISDIRDESSKEGIRVLVEIKRNAMGSVVLNNLYKHTQLEHTFGATMLAIDKNRPKVMNLRELLQCFLDHRFEVVTRRTKYDLAKAEARAHILQGLLKALDHLDEVVKTIRASNSRDEAKVNLIAKFDFSEVQALAILEMRLYQLTGLERDKVQAEYDAIQLQIAYYNELLADPAKIYGVIKDDLREIKATYATPRRSELMPDEGEINFEDLIEDRPCVISITHGGYIKRVPLETYREQRRGGKGVIGMDTKEEDFVEHVFACSTHDYLLVFTQQGHMYWLKGYAVPEAPRTSRGRAIANLLSIEASEKIASVVRVRDFPEDRFLVFATRTGIAKKTQLSAFKNIRAGGLKAVKIEEGDELIGVRLTNGSDEIMLVTREGMSIRFPESDLRSMGRDTVGVWGIELAGEGDAVVGVEIPRPGATLLVMSEKGYGKRTEFAEYRFQSRGGKGVITMQTTEKTGKVVAAHTVDEADSIMLISSHGQMIRMPVDGIRMTGRNAQGVRLINLDDGDALVAAAPIDEEEKDVEVPADIAGTPPVTASPETEIPAEKDPPSESGEEPAPAE